MQARPTYRQDSSAAPLISFIVTDYNVPVEMLTECLDSIFALSLSDSEREVILIDDGSDVSPINSILNYIDKIVYIRQRNQGLSVARNTGIEIAKGRYIQFVDGDDKIVPTAYEHCLDIVRYKQPDMVLFKMTTKDRQSSPSDANFSYEGPLSGTDYMRHNNLRPGAWGYIFSRSMLGTLRFHPGILHEDEEFTPLLVLRAERVYETSVKAYFYRQHSGTITHKKGTRWTLKRLDDTVEVLSVLCERAAVLPYEERLALQRRIEQLTMDYLYNVIRLTRNGHFLERCVARLRKMDLFPLPKRDYTTKYNCFRQMINSKFGRKILLLTLK